ncbi:MAG: FxsA family protein, partial [Nannocystaceae bacterium]|nr:FxsA family protein [Nannocystaceae bacterium]
MDKLRCGPQNAASGVTHAAHRGLLSDWAMSIPRRLVNYKTRGGLVNPSRQHARPACYVDLVVLGKLFLLFTVVPAVELYLLIQLGGALGAGPTIAIVLTTGLLGATLAKREGGRV